MKAMVRVALMVGLVMVGATSVDATEIPVPTDETTQVFVMNNYVTDVRVYIEDEAGHLHKIARLARGEVANFPVPAELAHGDFRVKVYPAAPLGSLISEDIGVKTNPLSVTRDHMVRLWLEADLTESIVEIARD